MCVENGKMVTFRVGRGGIKRRVESGTLMLTMLPKTLQNTVFIVVITNKKREKA